ncbi:MAG: TIGR03915 family putative DNA repair protein [Peptostreptococcales bacterium]
MNYLYDCTFDGLLTCIYEHYYNQKCEGIYCDESYQGNLLHDAITLSTDYSKSEKVYRAIYKKISPQALRHVHYAYLSNDYHKGTYILQYLVLGFKVGAFIDNYHAYEEVKGIHTLSRKVSFEAHRFLGLTRFSDIGHLLYAEITPDHDILMLLADHFSNRYLHEKFIIHDTKREKALFYADGHYEIQALNKKTKLLFSEKELFYRELWKNYFKNIAIKERENLRLQRQFMPNRYWKNLTEI